MVYYPNDFHTPMHLKIPLRWQKNDYYCGPASLQMVFAYFSIFKEQEEIAQIAESKPFVGTSNQGMIEAATKAGFHCYVNNESSFDELKHFLGKGLPVIVNYIEPDEEIGHYAVVSGLKDEMITLNDPWNGKNFSFTLDEFHKRWIDGTGRHPQWIMVLAKEDMHLGKQYAPQRA